MPRKQKKYHYIYKTTNNVTGKYYFGMHSTDNLEDSYLGSGRRLRYSINKYGKENHKKEILEYVENREKLIEREKEIVNLNEIAKEDCMNLMIGGKGGFVSETAIKKGAYTTNTKYKHKKREWGIKAGKSNYIKNGVHKNFIEKRYDWTDKKHSEKTKLKMSESHKKIHEGLNNSQYGTCWITNGTDNKKIYKGDTIPNGWKLGRIMKK